MFFKGLNNTQHKCKTHTGDRSKEDDEAVYLGLPRLAKGQTSRIVNWNSSSVLATQGSSADRHRESSLFPVLHYRKPTWVEYLRLTPVSIP